ncbi:MULTISPECIES: gluconate 2-dehydrogenase subunit 3 family protein [unclassified Stenotrophomonas maltophilia group]|uniref:gluconate 2-dehydrogenase subunit 3 family protein n=1 Tax=unclassified Stenotrophomonas maltophilia group TaxID=2961925 RepID=UPI000D53FE77|nr:MULTISPECIES: gluconate 2-dehydrogenase subunit 3 family protein [unclassified Stenotrophomonas maltophilia group]AWH36228.1 Twin-arginine translocation pathway signal [Stenotrophomonas sp. ZAC14D1_NAIMI4_6]AWH40419.1 Twin-arginine translocation pathway signal [Stenotrophomonas sp. ZAC14D1_NAIMI4_1]AWH46857.1 Twin-arginine translocation pathway signal [Stenotrophomonas sp. ZAC14A_NAIMI4_1]
MDRRELLKMIFAATGAAMIGLPTLASAKLPAPAASAGFSEAEIATLDEIAETILPRTRTPGAKDAATGAFMARFVTDCYTARQQATFRAGLADIDKRAGGSFVALAPEARTTLLRTLDAEARKRAVEVSETGTGETAKAMPHPFTMIKQLAIFGFFTSKQGATEVLKYVAVPGRYDGDMAYAPGTPAWATS